MTPRILLVEDSPTQRMALLEMLESDGFQVQLAEDGETALKLLDRQQFSLVLSDVQMPGMNGYDLCRAIRARINLDRLPIVLITMLSDPWDVMHGLECGADNYIAKPVQAALLLERVRQTLQRPVHADRDSKQAFLISTLQEVVHSRQREHDTELAQARAREMELQLQFQHAQKMEAVGSLAAGIAHDFNNLLTGVMGYGELLRDYVVGNAEAESMLDEIGRAADLAHALTRQLLLFSRREVARLETLDVGVVVRKLERMLRRLLGEDVHVEMRLDGGPFEVYMDAGQLEQIVLNLAVNARDAMPQGGRLRIVVERVEESGSVYHCLSVADTGEGMDEATQARIFEPFFTTKASGKGTGLGLANVHRIVEQCSGRVQVHSRLGEGTEFKVFLPVSTRQAEVAPPLLPTPAPGSVSATILLVEDDTSLRHLAARILKRAGYQVTSAADPAEAIRIAYQRDHIDLLLTDVVMPGMSGRQLAEQLARRRPEMAILYTSGYTDDAMLRYGIEHQTVDFIEKPYTANTLVKKVREVLEDASGRTRSAPRQAPTSS